MTLSALVREDNRLADMPMMPVACQRCGARVQARKSSWSQTSVQWTGLALGRCQERSAAAQLAPYGRCDLFLSCSALTESIADAVLTGTLRIVDASAGTSA